MTPSRERIAHALANYRPDTNNPLAGNPSPYDSQGLQQPAIDPIMMLSSAAGPAMARALSGMASSAPRILANEMGAIFPENTAADALPSVASGSKTGDPHALFAYEDMFGPGMTKRKIFNVFGDPAHPVFQKTGWGSSLPLEDLKQYGIPIIGKQAAKAFK